MNQNNETKVSITGKPIKEVKPKVATVKDNGETYINFDECKTN